MFARNKDKSLTSRGGSQSSTRGKIAPSVISSDMRVLGNIIGDGMIDLDGSVEGNVRATTVCIRPNGKVRGDVVADTVLVHGTVEGLIKARSVLLYSTARVQGTIMHESLSIEDCACVDGKFKRTDKVAFDDAISLTPALSYSPIIDTEFDYDNDAEPASEEEMRVLENLRLIS